MKQIKAIKVKDGWNITITDISTVFCESDVLKIIREHGLKVRKYLSHKPTKDNPNESLYAD